MNEFGQTLNLMSLGGMAVAIGLVIDDAIVVIENIYRHLELAAEQGTDKRAAIAVATQEIFGAVAGSTFTTVVVFLPLGLVEGVVGQFFAAFSITLSLAVLVSLVLAFTLIPLMADRFLSVQQAKQEVKSEKFLGPVKERYDHLVRRALNYPKIVLLILLVLVAAGVLIYFNLGSGFLPVMDEGSFVLDYWMPYGTSLAESNRVISTVERIIKDTPEVQSFSRRTGAELGLFATEQSRGDILVRLKKSRSRDVEEIMNDVRVKVESSLPSIRIEFVQVLQDILGDLEGSPEPVEVKIFGEDLHELQNRAQIIGERIEKIPGVVDLYNGIQQGNPEISVEVNPVELQKAGLDPETVSKQVSSALLGDVVTHLRQFDRLIGVRVRFPDNDRFNYDFIKQFPLVNEKTGAMIPLNAVASLKEENQQGELLRENQRQMIAVTGRIEGTTLGDAIAKVKDIINQVPLPPGYAYEIGGQYQSQQHSFRQLLLVLFIAIMLVYILLVIQFREFAASIVILSAAPVSLIGAFFMLWITGTEFNVSSFMGLIMLVGLIVKNGIILVEYTFRLHEEEGLPLQEALARAGHIRLRPILMTTLVTLFALLPLALGIGAGSELQKPLALAVIGGLSLSMFVTLLFVPVLLLKLRREH
jgi:multidrug efflux pump subunit AcrB